MYRLFCVAGLMLTLVGCATNPVTGNSELSMVSRAQEIEIGQQQYGPTQQSQGGEYDVDPAVGRYVSEVGQRIAAVSDNPLPYEFVVLNNSVPNAWALPGGKLAINRGLLLELNNEAELAAVLGHEVVHSAARHGAQAMTRGNLLQGAVVLGALISQGNDYGQYIVGASQLGAQLVNQRYGREAELEADAYGIRYMLEAGYDPHAAISLQETFVRLSEGQQQDWLSGLFASHPPSQERVARNRALVEELMPQIQGRDLENGAARYQQAMATLRETAPAYERMDEAQRAINAGEMDRALSLLDEAIAQVPSEARFHGLKADILLYREQYEEAIDVYDTALNHNAEYFEYYLGRGLARSRLGQAQTARQDLERSAQLLPTAIAMNEMGELALQQGNRQAAMGYFQMAAQGGQGEIAQASARSFARLDIQENPGRYLQVQALLGESGQVFTRVSNPTSLTLEDIRFTVVLIVNGEGLRTEVSLPVLEPGMSQDLVTGLRIPEGFESGQNEVRINVENMVVR